MTKLEVRDPGHNHTSANQSPDGSIKEFAVAQNIAELAGEMYKRIPEINQILTKQLMTYPTSLQGRVKVANDNKADIFQSDHTNAFGAWGEWTSPRGFGIYVHVNATKDSVRLAQIAHGHAKRILLPFGLPDRGIRYRDLYVINPRYNNRPAVLYEWAFHSNREDVKLLLTQEFRLACAEVSVRAACDFFGVKFVEGDNIMATPYHVVRPWNPYREGLSTIAGDNNTTVEKLMEWNPHVEHRDKILAGDMIYLAQPNEFEIKYAALNRQLLICQEGTAAIDKLKEEIAAEKELSATVMEENRKMRVDLKDIAAKSGKYV